jgi:hypothetical protein
VIRAWNIMGGLDWQALPIVAEMIGFEDIDVLIAQLVVLRDTPKD